MKFNSSALWRNINETILSEPESIDLGTFRDTESGSYANTRIAGWDLASNGTRFFKTLLFHEAQRLTNEDWDIIRRVKNRLLGSPVSVTIDGQSLCIDYLQAALEVRALRPVVETAVHYLEIGAGFGRTAHCLLENFPDIRNYTLVDLTPCLSLARRYLERVLEPALFQKLAFIEAESWNGRLAIPVDVALNIDSFAEMDAEIVDNYLAVIRSVAKSFYCKNPIAKYSPLSMGLPGGIAATDTALAAGKLKTIIDVFDSAKLAAEIPAFHQAYRPAGWETVASGFARPWHYYFETLYRRAG